MKLSEYVKKRNGVHLGASNSLRNMLYRSFGARNFAVFWNYWNPIWGYYLAYYSFKPLKIILPSSISLMLTFILCGMLHDVAISFIGGGISITFTIWFSVIGIAVLLTQITKLNFKKYSWYLRAFVNLLFIISTFLIAQYLKGEIKS